MYSKELSLGNQPLETQRWILPQFIGNWLAGLSVSKKHAGLWKLSAGFGTIRGGPGATPHHGGAAGGPTH